MQELFTHLGIDWRLIIAQGVNFFALAILLNYFLYKPLVKLLNDRRTRIEEGLKNADEAKKRLGEIDELRHAEVMKGEKQALSIIEEANKTSQGYKDKARKEAEQEVEAMKRKTEDLGRRLIQREMENLEKNSKELIEKAIFESVGLHPHEIDQKLVADAMGAIKKLR